MASETTSDKILQPVLAFLINLILELNVYKNRFVVKLAWSQNIYFVKHTILTKYFWKILAFSDSTFYFFGLY